MIGIGRTIAMHYTNVVELIVLGIVILVVAIDAIGRFDERKPPPRDPTVISTQKIIVDLTKRH